jgi:hypothetical protein
MRLQSHAVPNLEIQYISTIVSTQSRVIAHVLCAANRQALPALAALPGADAGLQQELIAYLTDSFGNSSRIDYGSGVPHVAPQPAFLTRRT